MGGCQWAVGLVSIDRMWTNLVGVKESQHSDCKLDEKEQGQAERKLEWAEVEVKEGDQTSSVKHVLEKPGTCTS